VPKVSSRSTTNEDEGLTAIVAEAEALIVV
jgi:hypothetical protein